MFAVRSGYRGTLTFHQCQLLISFVRLGIVCAFSTFTIKFFSTFNGYAGLKL